MFFAAVGLEADQSVGRPRQLHQVRRQFEVSGESFEHFPGQSPVQLEMLKENKVKLKHQIQNS